MTKSLKIILLLTIIATCGHVAKSDTKVLGHINFSIYRAYRDETISLENNKELVVKGVVVQRYEIPSDTDKLLKAITEYVADKDGYRAKYTLTKEDAVVILRLNPSTFKSLTG